jgi:hypothetical protein
MKVRVESPIPPTPPAASAVSAKVPEVVAEISDAFRISGPSAALAVTGKARTGKIHQLTASLLSDSYQTSSAATSHALVEDALSKFD